MSGIAFEGFIAGRARGWGVVVILFFMGGVKMVEQAGMRVKCGEEGKRA